MQDLSALPTKELIGIHNGLGPDIPISSWKKAKGLLIGRIETLQSAVPDPVPTVPKNVVAVKATEETPVSDVKPKPAKKRKYHRTIRQASVELLCLVEYSEDKTQPYGPDNVLASVVALDKDHQTVGLPYDEIIRRIQDEFDGCETSVACLRWYAVKIRAGEQDYENLRLPQRRPRVKPKRKGD